MRWSIITSLRGAMIDGLRNGLFDLAICDAPADEDMANLPLMREPLHVVLSHHHPLADRATIRPADLADVPYMSLHRGMGTPVEAQRFFAAGGVSPVPAVEVSDTRLVLELVAITQGFGIIPDSALSGAQSVVAVDTDPRIDRQIFLVHVAGRALPAAVESFAAHLMESWPDPGRPGRARAGESPL
jgi:DNA-binding transcriptional LysR family regulator